MIRRIFKPTTTTTTTPTLSCCFTSKRFIMLYGGSQNNPDQVELITESTPADLLFRSNTKNLKILLKPPSLSIRPPSDTRSERSQATENREQSDGEHDPADERAGWFGVVCQEGPIAVQCVHGSPPSPAVFGVLTSHTRESLYL